MDIFLRSIGLSNLDPSDVQDLIELTKDDSDKRRLIGTTKHKVHAEYYKSIGTGLGLTLSGTLDSEGEFTYANLLPSMHSLTRIPVKTLRIKKIYDTPVVSYTNPYGNEISFVLQNAVDYKYNSYKIARQYQNPDIVKTVRLGGLSLWGTILLPINRENEDAPEDFFCKNIVIKNKDIDDFRKSIMTMYQKDSQNLIRERLKEDDLLSVVDSYFLPMEDDYVYSYDVLGRIISVDTIINQHSGEDVYNLTINAAGFVLNIYINKYDVLGFPMVGMRFMGNCKLQGHVSIEN